MITTSLAIIYIEWGWVGYMKNSADQVVCYLQKPKAEVDNTLRDLQNSSYPMKAKFNNCFIIHSKYFLLLEGFSPLCSLFSAHQNITQPCPQVFSVNSSFDIILTSLVQKFSVGSTFDVIDSTWRRFFPNLVNSSSLWWIMRVVLTNQKQGNIVNE